MASADQGGPATTENLVPPRASFIAATWCGGGRGGHRALHSPVDGRLLADVPLCDADDLQRALDSAGRGLAAWGGLDPAARSGIIEAAADLLEQRRHAVAEAVTLETGKLLSESVAEVEFTASIMRFFASAAAEERGGVPGPRHVTLRVPIGVVAAFSPWNYPVTVPARKICAALAAGCPVIIKPAEEAPSGATAVVQALHDAGLPEGAVNLVLGEPAQVSQTLIGSDVVRAITFTGSTRVGRHIASLAAHFPKPCSLELGGHAPFLVFDDVDLDTTVARLVGGKLHNNSQSCGCPSRVIVQDGIHDEFVDRLVAAVRQVRVGDPFDAATQLGPVFTEQRLGAMAGFVDDARTHGATVALAGGQLDRPGWYWSPSVLTDVPTTAAIMNEEPFGPVIAVSRFRTDNDAVAEANRLPYGLGAYLETAAPDRLQRLPHLIQAGMVSVNGGGMGDQTTFFGGVRNSGYGSDGGVEAIDFFLQPKLVTWPPSATDAGRTDQ